MAFGHMARGNEYEKSLVKLGLTGKCLLYSRIKISLKICFFFGRYNFFSH